MERDDWIYALRHSSNDLFVDVKDILAIFVSTGRGFESILSRSSEAIVNIPQIYDTTRDLIFALKKLFEIFLGSVSLLDYEIEGETLRYNSYRIGYQRRVNFITNIEFSQGYLLKFISGALVNFPNKLIGAYGERETSIVHWSQNLDDQGLNKPSTTFLMRSALADTNNLLERSVLDMGIGNIKEVELQLQNNRNFMVVLTHDERDILLIEKKKEHEKWLLRLTDLFKRFSNDNPYLMQNSSDSKFTKSIIREMSMIIMRRFLAHLVPPKKRGEINLEKISKQTHLSIDLLIKFYNEYLKQESENYGISLKSTLDPKKSQRTRYKFIVENLSKSRTLTGSLMEIHKYYDQFITKLPSRIISASDQILELQNTSSYLGKIWGGFVYGKLIGDSDRLFILYNEILNELQGLNESRILLPQLENEAKENEDKDKEVYNIYFQQYENLKTYLVERIEKLNENITKFISLVVQSYLILLKTIVIPTKVITPKKVQTITEQLNLQFDVKDDTETGVKTHTLLDDPKDWIILVFFSYILSQNKKLDIFLNSCSKVLMSYYRGIEKTWDSLQLLTLESPDEEWKASINVSKLFIKPSRRKSMVTKVLNLI